MARALARKEETSTTLLEAAKKVLRQNGYAGLSTRDVAAAAGVPLSQIHYHFGSKQGLVMALFEYLNAQLLDRQNALFGDTALSFVAALGPRLRISRRRHRLGLRARPAGTHGRELGRRRGRQGDPCQPHGMDRSHRRRGARGRAAPGQPGPAHARGGGRTRRQLLHRRRKPLPARPRKARLAGTPGAAADRRSHPHGRNPLGLKGDLMRAKAAHRKDLSNATA